MAKKTDIKPDLSTEQKIKEAARNVFTKKGYAAARTRDIAEAAGINIALLNYYFRSKEKLFEQVMMERMQQLFGAIGPLMLETHTSLETKIENIVLHYIDLLKENPDLPIFVLSEIRKAPQDFTTKFPLIQIIEHSAFVSQLRERQPHLNPFHFLLNLLGMTVFPFITNAVFSNIHAVKQEGFDNMMEARKKLIPFWLNAMLEQEPLKS